MPYLGLHEYQTNVHRPYTWVVADEAARDALSVTADDLYKTALQLDDSSVWTLLDNSPMAWSQVGSGGAGSPSHSYFATKCALLEPDAIESLQRDSFSYNVGSTVTKWLIASWQTRLGASGRMEVRNPQQPLPLRDCTLVGTGSNSAAWIVDPSLPSYADAWTLYYDRLAAISELPTRYLPITAASSLFLLLPGPYGGFILQNTTFDLTWLAAKYNGPGINLENEINDTDDQRVGSSLYLPISKLVLSEIESGSGSGSGGIVFVLVDDTWSAVDDALAPYDFRDDFMGASLDTGSTWTRAQSTAGNVEIDTLYQWLKLVGNTSWGANGCYSQASISRAAGKVFLCDVYHGRQAGTSCIVGFHDGSGQSYTDFAHGVLFGTSDDLIVYEGGVSRGTVGSGVSQGSIYRIRITLGSSNDATYEIQGGSQYAALGGSTWDDITPGTSSNATTPLHAGVSAYDHTSYVSDVRIY